MSTFRPLNSGDGNYGNIAVKQEPQLTQTVSKIDFDLPQDTFIKSKNTNKTCQKTGSIVKIPAGASPSPEFVASVQQETQQMYQSLPQDLQKVLKARGFGVLVYRDSQEYLDKINHLDDLHPPESIQAVLDMGSHLGYSDDKLKRKILKQNKLYLPGCQAYYSPRYKNIIVHQDIPEIYKSTAPLDTLALFQAKRSENLLRHEMGHYLDYIPSRFDDRFSNRPEIRQLLHKDLRDACQKGIIPVEQAVEGGFRIIDSEKQKLKAILEKQYQAANVPPDEIEEILTPEGVDARLPNVIGNNHVCYYLPIFDEKTNEKYYPEAFAEITSGVLGGGGYTNPTFMAQEVYPKTAKYIEDYVLPEIYALPHEKQAGWKGF